MKQAFGGMLIFVTMIAVLVGILQVLNWIPAAIQDGALQKYASIDELRTHLKIGTVYTPAYFPRSVQWPPSLVAAQARPYPAVVMEFGSKRQGHSQAVRVRELLGQPDRLVASLPGLLRIAQIPQGQGRKVQAHHLRVQPIEEG